MRYLYLGLQCSIFAVETQVQIYDIHQQPERGVQRKIAV